MSAAEFHVVSVQTTAERGGAEYANVDLLRGLEARGVRVLLLTNLTEIGDGSGLDVEAIDIGPKLSKRTVGRVALGFLPWTAKLLWKLWRARARTGPIDVLLVHYKKEQLMAALVPRWMARSVVWAEWGPVPFEFRTGIPRRAYVLAARRAARIVAISEGTKRSIASVGVPADKITVVPNAADVDGLDFDAGARERLRREWGIPDGAFVTVCVGRFHPKKRNDVLIEMLDHLDEDVLLVLAGEGEDEPRLRELAAPLGDRVRFVATPRGTAGAILSAGDLAVFAPSPTEGAPMSIVMAQLARRPVVSTGPEGARDLIPAGTGTIVTPEHDARATAAVVEEYRRDRERLATEGEAARRWAAERHDRETVDDSFERIFRAAAAGRG